MKILNLTKWHLKMIGIFPVQNFPFKLREYQQFINRIHTILILLILISYTSSVECFLWFKAKTFVEYSEGAFYVSVSSLVVALYLALLWKKSELINFIEYLEIVAEQRKLIPKKKKQNVY